MSAYPGSGYLYAPITGTAYGYGGAYPGGGITYDTADPVAADKPVKAQTPMTRPFLSQTPGQWPGYGGFPMGFNMYFAWLMRKYPVCKVIHRKIAGPVLAGTQKYEVVEEGDDPDVAKAICDAANKALLPMFQKALPGAMEAPFFGNWLQEIIWDKVRVGRNAWRTDIVNVRPIMPYQRVIHVDEARQYTGYQYFGDYRDARYGFLSVHNQQIDDVLGWSENDAALTAFFRATKSGENADAIERKASGIQLLIYMMQGAQFVDGNGNPVDQQKFIAELMNAAVTGQSVLMPMIYFSKDTIERNPELAKVKLLEHEVVDWGNLGPMIEAHTGRLRDLHVQIGWAWGMSERSFMEADKGGMGTSDAGEHGDSNTEMSEQWHATACSQWDAQETTRWQDANFRDSGVVLKLNPSPLTDPVQGHLQKIQLALLADPTTAAETAAQIDNRKLQERTETPLLSPEDAAKKQADNEKKQQEADAMKAKQLAESKGVAGPNKGKQNADDKGKAGKQAD